MPQDQFHIPNKYTCDTRVYTATTSVENAGFKQWKKPKGASSVQFIVIGGGGGGGGGFTRTAGGPGGGGGGGGCSGISRFHCPAILLPDTLYVQVGSGGKGGAASVAGGQGFSSLITTSPKLFALPSLICYSGVLGSPPGGGGAGLVGAAGAGGVVPGIAVVQPPNVWGWWLTTIGIIGVAGGVQTGAVGVTVTAWTNMPLSPGAGGAGCTTTDFAGGDVTPQATLDMVSQGCYTSTSLVAKGGTAAGVGVNGGAGVNRITPLFCSGGAGGGSNNTGQAGIGGQGGYGCGGGGGGAGATGGAGGNGGGGLIIIISI